MTLKLTPRRRTHTGPVVYDRLAYQFGAQARPWDRGPQREQRSPYRGHQQQAHQYQGQHRKQGQAICTRQYGDPCGQ
ncbi:hypothetical protein ACWEWX_27275 [Streptomyces asiaticus]